MGRETRLGLIRPAVGDLPQPHCGWIHFRTMTQGSSFLATLGWRTQSRWDCKRVCSRIACWFIACASESFEEFTARIAHAKLSSRSDSLDALVTLVMRS